MEPLQDNTMGFTTAIKFPGVEITLEELDANLLDLGEEPTLAQTKGNYDWDWSISIGTDIDEEEGLEDHDLLVCYINAQLNFPGAKCFAFLINTLHSYHISKLSYKKEHEEIYKSIARESLAHANILLANLVKGTTLEGFVLPEVEEEEMNEYARYWNKRGYLPPANKPDEHALGGRPTTEELNAMSERSAELVKFVDAFAEEERDHTEEETNEYLLKYAELLTINKRLWHFKHIARNLIGYNLTKMMEKLEKGLKKEPDNFMLRETYESMKVEYITFMKAHENEWMKN